jgi:large subunit ribosomal protein L23
MNNVTSHKRIIIKPLISEKSISNVDSMNKYTFIVETDSNKIEIGQEIEKTFGVKVLDVKTVNYTGKIVAFGKKRIAGRRDNFKKAIVTLKKGDKISIFDIK